MNMLDKDYSKGLFNQPAPPCLSVYLPTHRHHPANQQDPIRFTNLVKSLHQSLLQQYSEEQIQPLLAPFLALAENRDFWGHTLDGLAVLGNKDLFRVYKLQRPVAELAVVADNFHIKPLLRIMQSADRYHILAVNRQEVKLFEGNRDALAQVELAPQVPRTITDALGEELTAPRQTVGSYGGPGGAGMHHGHGGRKAEVDKDAERFFRAVDRAVLEHHSQPSGLPLFLAALTEHHHTFHEVSHNPFLQSEGIDVHPDSLASIDELRQRAWQLVEPTYLKRLADLVEEFGNARSKGLGGDDIQEVGKAIADGRVATALIEARREIPGRINGETGEVTFEALDSPEVDDLLDELAAFTLRMGGKVIIVPKERMPTDTGIAATYRF